MNRLVGALVLTGVVALGACGDDDEVRPDAAQQMVDAAMMMADAAPADAGAPDAMQQSAVERGDYVVNHIAGCPGCHSVLNPDGSIDPGALLAGNAMFADIIPEDDTMGLITTPNLRPPTGGITTWSDDEVKNAFRNGMRPDGSAIFAIMPYYVYHNMSDDDADAVVAYLRSLDPIDNQVPPRQPLPFPVMAAAPVSVDDIPDTTLDPSDENYATAQQGKYLAGHIGVCMECHSPESAPMSPTPIDTTRLFAGGRPFPSAAFGLPSPPFPEIIYSRNLTPDATGIQGWTPQQVATALKMGIDDDGDGICPPMPVGPIGEFGGITDEDALAIGMYLTTLAPIDNMPPGDCMVPGM